MEEQGHSRDGEAGPPAVEMVVLTGVSTSNSPSPRSSYGTITLVASVSLPLAVSVFVFLFASLSVTLLNILFLSKARQASTT